MFLSGFTFVRNGVKHDYPFEESILSILPLVDELVVNVGVGEDDTLARVKALAEKNPKILLFESVWDERMKKDGLILSAQTNLAMDRCRGDWGLYIQADEVIHEHDYPAIRSALAAAADNPAVDGLIFDYIHFYGDFFIVNQNPSAYRREVRLVSLRRGIVSWKDAQGFRRREGDAYAKLRVIPSGASIYHYGWVRPPEVMRQKTVEMDKLYHGGTDGGTGENYRYKRIYGLERFTGTHPKVMEARVAEKRWKVDLMAAPLVFTPKDIRKVIARSVERLTGWLPGHYKNYKRIG